MDTRRHSDSPIDIGSGVDAAVVTGSIVKFEANASPSHIPQLPLHNPCAPNHDINTWAIHTNRRRK